MLIKTNSEASSFEGRSPQARSDHKLMCSSRPGISGRPDRVVHSVGIDRFNDPSAGSPTETLLRLLLPLSDKVYLTSHNQVKPDHSPEGSPDHSKSVGATGGVYKGQGRNQRELMTRAY